MSIEVPQQGWIPYDGESLDDLIRIYPTHDRLILRVVQQGLSTPEAGWDVLEGKYLSLCQKLNHPRFATQRDAVQFADTYVIEMLQKRIQEDIACMRYLQMHPKGWDTLQEQIASGHFDHSHDE